MRDDKCSSHMLMVHELRIARRDNLTDHVSSVTRSFHPPIADWQDINGRVGPVHTVEADDRCDCLSHEGQEKAGCRNERGQRGNKHSQWQWQTWTSNRRLRCCELLGVVSGALDLCENKSMWQGCGTHLGVLDGMGMTMWMLTSGCMPRKICMCYAQLLLPSFLTDHPISAFSNWNFLFKINYINSILLIYNI